MSIGEIIVFLIVGALAGSLTGRIVTRNKQGFGRWMNFGVGLAGALVGGGLFNLFGIDLGLGELKVTFEDLLAAVIGSFLFLFGLAVFRRYRSK
ncbi:MAG: GlsB/YeaQ/YmgE family stress response membrane protein [Planctomycetota bacterium]